MEGLWFNINIQGDPLLPECLQRDVNFMRETK